MKVRTTLRLAVVPVALAGSLVACGSSTSTPTVGATSAPSSTTAPTSAPATPTAALDSLTCPTVDTVNSALGVTIADPTSDPADGLPTGSTGVTCTYTAGPAGSAVVIVLVAGPAATSFVSRVEAGEQSSAQAKGATYTATGISGVGSQAALVSVTGGSDPDENGILAATASSAVSVTVIPPASQSQLQSFASQLLG